jgi:alpha-galactosidase
MFSSPLMAGNDIRTMSKETAAVLTNKEVIAVDQDSLGICAIRYMKYGDLEIWFKPLAKGEFAFCFFNRGPQPVTVNEDLKTTIRKYTIDGSFKIRDLWSHKEIGTTGENIKATLPAHEVLLIRLVK